MHRPQFDTSAAISRERYWSKMTGFGAKLMRYGASYPDKKTCLGTRYWSRLSFSSSFSSSSSSSAAAAAASSSTIPPEGVLSQNARLERTSVS